MSKFKKSESGMNTLMHCLEAVASHQFSMQDVLSRSPIASESCAINLGVHHEMDKRILFYFVFSN